jgi:hypothetical protein
MLSNDHREATEYCAPLQGGIAVLRKRSASCIISRVCADFQCIRTVGVDTQNYTTGTSYGVGESTGAKCVYDQAIRADYYINRKTKRKTLEKMLSTR